LFFIASKLFWIVARPLNFIFFLAIAGWIAGMFGWRAVSRIMLGTSFVLFALIGFTQLTDYLLLRLEKAVPTETLPADPAGIIVLGGGVKPLSAAGGEGYSLAEAGDRLIHGLELKRRFPQARLIYSGGASPFEGNGMPETAGAVAMVRALYGDDRGMELESKSRSTAENAAEVSAMLGTGKDSPFLLVTSAFHMPRAVLTFRKAGVNVIPVSTDFRAEPLAFPYLTEEAPNQFVKASLLVKEFVGLLAYYFAGRIDSPWPQDRDLVSMALPAGNL
jgi:uncharacterized SAM-binding protein YcdF (DUF218 family)